MTSKKTKKEVPKIVRAYGAEVRQVLEMDMKKIKHFIKIFNNKTFSVGDTPLTYRQINYLDNNNILVDKREKNSHWRRFSFKELVFLNILNEIKKYGVKDTLTKDLSKIFFSKNTTRQVDIAMIMASGKVQIILVIQGNDIFFTDIPGVAFNNLESAKSFLQINLNEFMNDIWEQTSVGKIDYKSESELMAEIIGDFDISVKEADILKIIRDKNYQTITIKKDNEKFIIGAQKINSDSISEKEAMGLITDGEFSNISITRRNGKIVNIKKEDIHKI